MINTILAGSRLDLLSKEGSHDESRHRGAEEREIGVDDGPMEGVSVSQNSVKAWPVDPEEDRPDHGEDVRGVSGALHVLRLLVLPTPAHHGHGKAEVGTKGVDENSTA